MWDLETIVAMNLPKTIEHLHIYDLGNNKFALGNKGKRAVSVIRRIPNKVDSLGRGLPEYKGVQARKPRIPVTARLVRREDAGRLMLRAFGLR
jgi:hypothetical protein